MQGRKIRTKLVAHVITAETCDPNVDVQNFTVRLSQAGYYLHDFDGRIVRGTDHFTQVAA